MPSKFKAFAIALTMLCTSDWVMFKTAIINLKQKCVKSEEMTT